VGHVVEHVVPAAADTDEFCRRGGRGPARAPCRGRPVPPSRQGPARRARPGAGGGNCLIPLISTRIIGLRQPRPTGHPGSGWPDEWSHR
jgi:hypothetical protein